MPVLSIRLDDESLQRIRELASREHKGQSAVARELIAQGWDYAMLRRYKEGHISLGKLSEELGKSVAETLDLLADLGVPAPIDYDDYLEGFETLRLNGRKKR